MKYQNVIQAVFVSRPNRFIAKVEIDGNTETVHVKNTGRCKEILIPGAIVYLAVGDNPNRKTKFDLIAVEKETEQGRILINLDSQAPNHVAYEWLPKSNLFLKNANIQREVTFGSSRFDIFVTDGDRKAFVEVKGVTLEKEGVAMFPDAPTERGVKHVNELIKAINNGYEAYILFVVQMKGIHKFTPNKERHKVFADALINAEKAGVKILAMDCIVESNTLSIDQEILVEL